MDKQPVSRVTMFWKACFWKQFLCAWLVKLHTFLLLSIFAHFIPTYAAARTTITLICFSTLLTRRMSNSDQFNGFRPGHDFWQRKSFVHVMKLSRLDVQEGNKLCAAEDYGAVAKCNPFYRSNCVGVHLRLRVLTWFWYKHSHFDPITRPDLTVNLSWRQASRWHEG